MKRLVQLLVLASLCAGAHPLFAQDFPQEPENHTVVVERLMRYHDYSEYDRETQVVADSAQEYLAAAVKSAPKEDKLAAVFDIDETSLSNWEAMAGCGFCAYAVALTIKNLNEAGYSGWTELIMQPDGDKLPAGVFKPKDRQEIVDEGYRIVLNIGDQASDLAGCCAERVFKIPNPFYLLK